MIESINKPKHLHTHVHLWIANFPNKLQQPLDKDVYLFCVILPLFSLLISFIISLLFFITVRWIWRHFVYGTRLDWSPLTALLRHTLRAFGARFTETPTPSDSCPPCPTTRTTPLIYRICVPQLALGFGFWLFCKTNLQVHK